MPDKTVAQKLLIKDTHKVLFVNPPKGYKTLLGELPKGATALGGKTQAADAILLFANNRNELETHLSALQSALAPKGMIWVAYHKGTSKVKTDINRDSIAAYAGNLGLTAVAMISMNEDWSALRLKVS